MPQIKPKGQIVDKTIMPHRFEVVYQCACGSKVRFGREQVTICQGCQQPYQLRVLVGKVAGKEEREG